MDANEVRMRLMALLALPVEELDHDEINRVRYLLDVYRSTVSHEANERLKKRIDSARGVRN